MAKIIINIPEKEFGIEINDKFQDFFKRLKTEIHAHLIDNSSLLCGAYELETIEMFLEAFSNITLLPKGHGRLIEQQAVIDCLENTAKYYDMPQSDEWTKGIHYGLLHGVDNILDNVPTVIEADRGDIDGSNSN